MPTQHADDSDTETEITDEQLETHWIAVLSEYWRQADWDQFSNQQKPRADSFGERLEVATRAGGVTAALDKLAKGLGMASPSLPTEHLDPLKDNERQAMRVLRRDKIWLVNKTDETIQNYYDALDGDGDGQDAPEGEVAGTSTELSDFINN